MKVIYPEDLLDTETYPKSKSVIYLFGWAGASEEKMGKYSQIYKQAGYITAVTCTAPWSYINQEQDWKSFSVQDREILYNKTFSNLQLLLSLKSARYQKFNPKLIFV